MPYVRGTSVDFGRDVLWLWQQAGSRAASQRVEVEAVSGRVIPGSPSEYSIAHPFETAALIPCFTPNWNTNIPVARIDSSRFYARFSTTPPARGATIDYALVRGSSATVTTGATSYTITHNLGDATVAVLVATSWNTTVKRTSKAANSMVVDFSVSAPSGNAIYWSAHSDSTDIYEDSDAVTGNATEFTLTHNAGIINLPTFFLPNWNTTIWFTTRTETQATVRFSNSAPSGGGLLDWRMKRVSVN